MGEPREPTLLDVIANKERDIRARLLAARARADALVAEARAMAEETRFRGKSDAAAEAREWMERELAAAKREAEEAVARATAETRDRAADPKRIEAAVRLILEAVLLKPPLAGAELQAQLPVARSQTGHFCWEE